MGGARESRRAPSSGASVVVALLGVALLLPVPGGPTGLLAPVLRAPEPWEASGASYGPPEPISARTIGAAGPAPAWSTPAWLDITSFSHTQLPVIETTAGAWDTNASEIVVYGGDSDSGYFDTGWTYADGNWSVVNPRGDPGPLNGMVLGDDPSDGGVVLFGGIQSASPVRYNNTTWLFRDGSWSADPTRVDPPARYEASMVYDPALGGDLLFGGLNLSVGNSVLNDLWLFQHGLWSRVHATTPPPGRDYAAMAYDPLLNETVVFGGFVDDTGAFLNDTWAFSAGSWHHLETGADSPPALAGAMMDFDPDLGGIVLTGGVEASEASSNVTWFFNGTTWSVLNTTGPAEGNFGAVGLWDPVEHAFVQAGGNETMNRTLLLVQPLHLANVTGPTGVDLSQWASFAPTIAGGPRPVRYAWSFDGVAANTTENASHQFTTVGPHLVALTVVAPGVPPAVWSGTVEVNEPLTVAVGVTTGGLDAGVPGQLTATVQGGVSPYAVTWSFGDGTEGNGSPVLHTFDAPGTYGVSAHVTDGVGELVTGSTEVPVNASPSAGLSIGRAAGVPVEVNVPVDLNLSVTGGTPPFRANWSFGDGAYAAGLSVEHAFPVAGTVLLVANVTDAAGGSFQLGETLAVVPGPSLSVRGPSHPVAGTAYAWTAVATGGLAPYAIVWGVAGEAPRHGADVSFAFPSAGQYRLSVTVNDSAGGQAEVTENLTVSAGPSPAPSWLSASTLPLLAGVGAVAVVAGAVLWRLARHRRPPPTP